MNQVCRLAAFALALLAGAAASAEEGTTRKLDFTRDIRPLLSNHCFQCHGPDAEERKGGTDGLRLDTAAGALQDLGGYAAIVPGRPEASEVVARIRSTDPDLLMPPPATGKPLSAADQDLLETWIREGAAYAGHWSYEVPVRPELPAVRHTAWPRHDIDYFVLSRLEREGLSPSPEADRYTLARRLALDLTGLPPTLEEVDRFVQDPAPDAYEQYVDRLLEKSSYGEHWARMWLDLARYADSAGYADDPPRTIWAYRDYVIRSFNENKPFDQFTLEQLAGDLLPDPSVDQLVATAFHRNTLTNNEGGTNDEEFRNVAIVDRVNTTFAVWMGTTIDCAQCHNHKYDPISQAEFFRVFAVLNNTEDADRRDESPLVEIWSPEQLEQKAKWERELAELRREVSTLTPELTTGLAAWERDLGAEPAWQALRPSEVQSASGSELSLAENKVVAAKPANTDTYTLTFPLAANQALTGLRLETLPDEALPQGGPGFAGGNFVVSRVRAELVPPAGTTTSGRFLRIEIPGQQRILSLAEVQVWGSDTNLALKGEATQSSTDYDGPAKLAIDGNTNGQYHEAKSTTHTAISDNPWWEVDLQSAQRVDRIVIWNRTDANVGMRLKDFRVALLDEQRAVVWEQTIAEPPQPSRELSLSGVRGVELSAAFADHAQAGFPAAAVLRNEDLANKGWAIAPRTGEPHFLTLILSQTLKAGEGEALRLSIDQHYKSAHHTVGQLRLSATDDSRVAAYAQIPPDVIAVLRTPAAERTEPQRKRLAEHFLATTPLLAEPRQRLSQLDKSLAEQKPTTTVPVLREKPASERRVTRLQFRGNFMDLGEEVAPGVPAAFHPLPQAESADRLALARWIMDEKNPLTPRVIANRYWEQVFGMGIVRTSEEFGSQGELPTHPELLDWLATELIRTDWNLKQFLKTIVTSATYRQSSRVSEELLERDPDNRLFARGPRFRLSAEMIRDQALFVSGLLSDKMYGPPVKPLQPTLGVNAAFGSGIDWQTSEGEDKYRRGLYTTWRRSNPYPSMAAFDAPNREVCTVRRDRTNTPMQALVTLNDPVYIEAAQALARRMVAAAEDSHERIRLGFRLCVARPPSDEELTKLAALYAAAHAQFTQHPEQAKQLATEPIGPLPEGQNAADLAAWTLVCNVLLNLDEFLMNP